jgi:hypothetical protein
MRRLIVSLATAAVLTLPIPLAGAAVTPASPAAPRACPKDNRPMSTFCRTAQDAKGRADQLLAGLPKK